jgi:hypothetical protein
MHAADRKRIDKENRKLAEDLFKIMSGHGIVTESLSKAPSYKHPGTINFNHRLAEAKRIYNENRYMAYRLENIKAHYTAIYNVGAKPGNPTWNKNSGRKAHPSRQFGDQEVQDPTTEGAGVSTSAGEAVTAGAVAEEFSGQNAPPRSISPSPRPPSRVQSSPPSRSSSSRAARVYMANSIVLVAPNTPRHDRMHTAPSSKARHLSNMHVVQEEIDNCDPLGPASQHHIKPKNLILEHWKIQDGDVLEVAVLKAPYEDQYSILGIDNKNNKKFQLDISSEQVTDELEGDFLVTSLENPEVWKALLEKVNLRCVSEFTRPGTSRSNKPQTAPFRHQASPQQFDADWTDAFAPSPSHVFSSPDAHVAAVSAPLRIETETSEVAGTQVSAANTLLSPIRDEDTTAVSIVTEEGEYDDYNEEWANADAITVPMQTVDEALGLDKSIESYYAEDTFEDIIQDANTVGYDPDSPSYTGLIVNKSSDMLVVPPPFDAPARPITADRFNQISTAERMNRNRGQEDQTAKSANCGANNSSSRPSSLSVPPLPLNALKATAARPPRRRNHSIIAPPPIIKIKHVVIGSSKKNRPAGKKNVTLHRQQEVASSGQEENKDKLETIAPSRKPRPKRTSSPAKTEQRPQWNDSSVIPAVVVRRDQSVIREDISQRRKYSGETYENASAFIRSIQATQRLDASENSAKVSIDSETKAESGPTVVASSGKENSTVAVTENLSANKILEAHVDAAGEGRNASDDAPVVHDIPSVAEPHPPAGPRPSGSGVRPGNSSGSRTRPSVKSTDAENFEYNPLRMSHQRGDNNSTLRNTNTAEPSMCSQGN